MLVPQFWAEAKEKKIIDGRQVTIRRFGWSDESDSSAQKHARERVAEAMSLVESGEKIRRRDPKVPYNGAEGVPIREEIVSRHRDSVITRNSYGALCINTPDVLFADIDFQYKPSSKFYWISFFIFLAITSIALYMKSWIVFVVLLFLGFAIVSWVAGLIFKMLHLIQGSEEDIAMGRIKKFSEEHPDWHLRIYETPKGYRVLVMHETFNANDREAIEFLQALHSDPIYIQMCKNQNCFRARVSPKPWRIDVERLKPRPGVWPIAPERMSDRIDWVKNYEQVSINYASCRFLEKLGADVVDSKAEFIRTL
jgi:hypothetical protein